MCRRVLSLQGGVGGVLPHAAEVNEASWLALQGGRSNVSLRTDESGP